ncbi:hypothetical protein [Roseobacter litoralis]|uniref:hypothetical protein n=1 Tax=Roseobacter litoralis TaxID=42443 RepID=UPI0024953C68|nr:hypothetical protein [Roseobacter litoralis]
MMLSFHKSALKPGAPRFLPHPLVTMVLSLGAGLPLEDSIQSFLHQNGVDTGVARNRWYVEIWHRGDVDEIAAKASFAWHDGNVVVEAVHIEPDHHGLNLEPFLYTLGFGLSEGKAFRDTSIRSPTNPIDPALITATANGETLTKGHHPRFFKLGEMGPKVHRTAESAVMFSGLLRKHAKDTFNALLQAKTLRASEPRDFDTDAHGMTSEAFRQSVTDSYPMLPDIFGSRVGMTLMREESDLAEKVITHFVSKGVAILPIHDGFIAQSHHKAELVQVMKYVFQQQYGKNKQ